MGGVVEKLAGILGMDPQEIHKKSTSKNASTNLLK
jgi:hypothetical protein